MASNTPYLDLYKANPVTDGDHTFNIDTLLNGNWDKVDAALANKDIKLEKDTAVYVSKTGNDLTGDGSVANPYHTIQKAIAVLPRNLNVYGAYVYVSAGIYEEDVTIQNFYGGGRLSLKPHNGAEVSVKSVYCKDLTIGRLIVEGLIIHGKHRADENGASILMEYCSGYLHFSGIRITASAPLADRYGAVSFRACPVSYVAESEISNQPIAISSIGSIVHIDRIAGNGNGIVLQAGSGWGTAGGIIFRAKNTIQGTTAEQKQFGGQIW